MKIYDTLIIGSGYTALGYAIERGNTLIVEESESCDVGFSLAQRRFALPDYEAKNPLTNEILEHYKSLGLISDGITNTGALECGFCDYALKKGAEIFLKCRVIAVDARDDGTVRVSIVGGGGIEYIFARRVIDMRGRSGERWLTALFTTDNPDSDIPALLSAYTDGEIEPAFYEGRYALHLPALDGEDVNSARIRLYAIWDETAHTAKLLYTAPTLSYERAEKSDAPTDSSFDTFIEAFDAGVAFAKEAEL